MRDLTRGPILGHLLSMTLFLMGSMLVQSLYFLADMYWIGRLGRDAIAAVGLAANVMLLVLAATQALGVGTTALVSRAVGEGNREHANLLFNQALSLSIVCGAVFLLAGLALSRAYVDWLAADPLTRTYAESYLVLFVPAFALQYPLIATGAALRACAVVRPTVVIFAVSVALNLVLAPVLIFGWGTGHPFGVIGAAAATLIALVIGGSMMLIYLTAIHDYLHIHVSQWRPSMATWREILAIGLPSGAELGVLAVYLLIVYSLLRPFGAAAQGGFAVGARIGQSLILPAVAVAMANAPIVGQNFGARNGERIRSAFALATVVGVAVMGLMMFIIRLYASAIVRVFTKDDEVVRIGAGYLKILALTFVATAVIFAVVSVFQGLGRTTKPFLSSVVRLVAFFIPALMLSRMPSFTLTKLWALSAGSIFVQAAVNLVFLSLELRSLPQRFAPQPQPEPSSSL
jgi:putative MATE family efflux protein